MVQKPLLNDTPKKLTEKYRSIIENAGISVDKIILFGSYAKGLERWDSDLDLCIVSKKFGKKPFDDLILLKRLTVQVDTMIEPMPFHPDEFIHPTDPLTVEILQTGIVM